MKKVWLITGALVGGISGASLGACGNGGTGGAGGAGGSAATTTTATTATTTTTTTTTTTSSSVGGGNVGGSGSGGGDAGECSAVTTLHPPHLDAGPGTIYCPFSSVGDAGNEYCTPETQHCCETPEGAASPSACQPAATACMVGSGYTDWQCEDPAADCPAASPVCCATGPAADTPSIGLGAPGCGNFAHDMNGTKCVAAGACVGITMCTSDGECPNGQTCTPFGKAGNQVGGCM